MGVMRSGLRGTSGVVVLIWLSLLAAQAQAATSWTVVPSPNANDNPNYLASVAVVGPSDVWAVGADYRDIAAPGPLVEHWDGSAWSLVPAPALNDLYNELFGVAASSSADVWAVGYAQHGSGLYGAEKSLIEHWNGSAWRIVPSPNIGTKANILYGVAAISATDAWAVGLGNSSTNQSGRTLVEHWDGNRWRLVRTPNPGPGISELYGVTALSSTDVWAVGVHKGATLVEHWNGTRWSIVPSDGGGSGSGALNAISMVSPTDGWAVGTTGGRTLTEHWDGVAWSVVDSPNGSLPTSQLEGVWSAGPDDIWAVGFSENSLTVTLRTLTMHWDGVSWTVVPSPNPGPDYNAVVAVAGTPGGDVWAVGNQDEGTLTLRTTDG